MLIEATSDKPIDCWLSTIIKHNLPERYYPLLIVKYYEPLFGEIFSTVKYKLLLFTLFTTSKSSALLAIIFTTLFTTMNYLLQPVALQSIDTPLLTILRILTTISTISTIIFWSQLVAIFANHDSSQVANHYKRRLTIINNYEPSHDKPLFPIINQD